jgi:hypothetical protein
MHMYMHMYMYMYVSTCPFSLSVRFQLTCARYR